MVRQIDAPSGSFRGVLAPAVADHDGAAPELQESSPLPAIEHRHVAALTGGARLASGRSRASISCWPSMHPADDVARRPPSSRTQRPVTRADRRAADGRRADRADAGRALPTRVAAASGPRTTARCRRRCAPNATATMVRRRHRCLHRAGAGRRARDDARHPRCRRRRSAGAPRARRIGRGGGDGCAGVHPRWPDLPARRRRPARPAARPGNGGARVDPRRAADRARRRCTTRPPRRAGHSRPTRNASSSSSAATAERSSRHPTCCTPGPADNDQGDTDVVSSAQQMMREMVDSGLAKPDGSGGIVFTMPPSSMTASAGTQRLAGDAPTAHAASQTHWDPLGIVRQHAGQGSGQRHAGHRRVDVRVQRRVHGRAAPRAGRRRIASSGASRSRTPSPNCAWSTCAGSS